MTKPSVYKTYEYEDGYKDGYSGKTYFLATRYYNLKQMPNIPVKIWSIQAYEEYKHGVLDGFQDRKEMLRILKG